MKFFKGFMILILIIILLPVVVFALVFQPYVKAPVYDNPVEITGLIGSQVVFQDTEAGVMNDILITEDVINSLLYENIQEEEIESVYTKLKDDKISIYAIASLDWFKTRAKVTLDTSETNGEYVKAKVNNLRIGLLPIPVSLVKLIFRNVELEEIQYVDFENLEAVIRYEEIDLEKNAGIDFIELRNVNVLNNEVKISYEYKNTKSFNELSGVMSIVKTGVDTLLNNEEVINSILTVSSNDEFKNVITDLQTKVKESGFENLDYNELSNVITVFEQMSHEERNQIIEVIINELPKEDLENMMNSLGEMK